MRKKSERPQKSPRRPGGKLRLLLEVCMAVCICMAGVLWVLRVRGDRAVTIRPEKDYQAGEVVFYDQTDKRWSGDKLGASVYTMKSSGCLTTCIASSLSTQWSREGAGRPMTPGELNEYFKEQGVYNDSGDILWDRLREALPDGEVYAASSVRGEEIEELLAQGHYPIVKVKMYGRGAQHWVLLVGGEDGEYFCMDPLLNQGELVPLSLHGGKVYRMRCVYWKD